jgi:capsular exopolysaccharide synthesis family protein
VGKSELSGASVTFQDYVRVLRERWLLVVFGLILGVVGAGAHTYLATPQYATSSTFFISTPGLSDDVSQAYQGSLLSEQKIKSYTQLATDRRLREQVSDKLGSPVAAGTISASARPDTVLLTITVTDPSPQRAQRIAELASAGFIELVAEVEKPVDGTAPPVVAKKVQGPPLPTSPVSPKPVRDAALGTILGLMLGVGMAVARHTLDRSVKSPEVLVELAQAPALGATVFDSTVKSKPLVVVDNPQSPLAESFRQLRTNLQYVDLDHAQKLIVVTSALPNEGKTTTTCNLAIALAQGGAKVALVEADLRRPRAGALLGLDNAVGLTSVLTSQVYLYDAMQPWGGTSLDFLGSGPLPPNPSEMLASRQMRELLGELAGRYDVVLFDAPPTLPVADASVLAAQCHGTLLVARFGKVNAEQVAAAAETLNRVSANVIGTVLTMAPRSGRRSGYAYQYSYSSRPDFVQGVALPAEPNPPARHAARAHPEVPVPPVHAVSTDWVALLPEARNGHEPFNGAVNGAAAHRTAGF